MKSLKDRKIKETATTEYSDKNLNKTKHTETYNCQIKKDGDKKYFHLTKEKDSWELLVYNCYIKSLRTTQHKPMMERVKLPGNILVSPQEMTPKYFPHTSILNNALESRQKIKVRKMCTC